MNFIDLEGKGMLIALALIMFISAALMFYFQKRFVMLENSILQQGKILQSFIMKSNASQLSEPMQEYSQQYSQQYKEENEGEGECEGEGQQYLGSEIAINSAQQQLNNLSSKIDVSDESNSEYDSEYDSKSEYDSNSEYDSRSESDSDNDNNESKIITLNSMNNDLNVELIGDNMIEDTALVNKLDIFNMNELNNMDEVNVNIDDSLMIEPSTQVNLKDIIDSTTLMLENEITDASLDKIKNIDELNTIKKMKVSELREMVLEKGLVEDLDNANKMKKEQLLKILQK